MHLPKPTIIAIIATLAGCVKPNDLRVGDLDPAGVPMAISAKAEQGPKRFDAPREAAEFWVRQRLPEGAAAIDPAWYERALADAAQLPLWSSSANRPGDGLAPLAGLSPWTALGPGNIGGRTRAFALRPGAPTTLYAGGVAGGLWRSTDAGASWQPLSDLLPNIAVNSMAIDTTNPDRMFIGTGEGFFNIDAVRGAGIFRSLDGGLSWERLASTNTPSFRFVNDLAISPNNANVIYAATGDGIHRSSDGGATWTQVYNQSTAPAVSRGCLDLVVKPGANPDTVFASCGNFEPGKILRNTNANGAGTWDLVYSEATMGRASLAIAPSAPDTIYALLACTDACGDYVDGVRAVIRSTSGGAAGTWSDRFRNNLSNPPTVAAQAILSNPVFAFLPECGFGTRGIFSQGWYDNVIAVDPVDANRVWVGGIDLMRSSDGGQTFAMASHWWFNQTSPNFVHADQHAIVFHPGYNGTSNQTMYVANDGGIYRTSNAAAAAAPQTIAGICGQAGSLPAITWSNLNNGYAVTQFYYGAVYPDRNSFFGGTQDNGTVRGTTGGGPNAWVELLGGDGAAVAVDPGNTQILYAANTDISIQKSTNGGTTWVDAINGISDEGLFINPFVMDPNNAQRLWTSGSFMWRTNDGAANWVRASANGPTGIHRYSAYAVAPGNSNLVVAGTSNGQIFRTTSATTATSATTWTSSTPRSGFVSSIAFDPANPNNVYATYSTFGGQKVWRSTDGGQNFTAIDGTAPAVLPDVPVHALAVDPTNGNRLFVGTDIGVFVSPNGGTTWMRENAGFANTVVETLEIRNTAPQPVIFAFTHGRGVYRSTLQPITTSCRGGAAAAIPDNAPAGLISTLTAAGNFQLGDLNVELRITHPRVADLSVSLRHVASNTTVTLGNFASASPPCAVGDIHAIVDDDADLPVVQQCSAFTPAVAGVFRPANPLSAFHTRPLVGNWELRVVDQAAGNTGSLVDWCLYGTSNGTAASGDSIFANGFEP